MREHYREHAMPVTLPFNPQAVEMVGPVSGRFPGMVGNAFDYLARVKVFREFEGTSISVIDRPWVAEDGLVMLKHLPNTKGHRRRWGTLFRKSREALERYSVGYDIEFDELCYSAQILSNLDGAYRSGYFNPLWEPLKDITDELRAMLENFHPRRKFRATSAVILNPTFALSHVVGGADADIIYDDVIVEIKTTKYLNPRIDYMRQLVGYAALQELGGIYSHSPYVTSIRCKEIGIYYARFGRFIRWRLVDLFPHGSFLKFVKAFEEEAKTYLEHRVEFSEPVP